MKLETEQYHVIESSSSLSLLLLTICQSRLSHALPPALHFLSLPNTSLSNRKPARRCQAWEHYTLGAILHVDSERWAPRGTQFEMADIDTDV